MAATTTRRASVSRSSWRARGGATSTRRTSRTSLPVSAPAPRKCSRSGISSKAKIVGVQAAGADAFTRSWRGSERVTADRVDTFAEGMATRVTFDLTFAILKEQLDDIVTLDEPELEEGVRAALRFTHNLAEGSGAAPLAAAKKYGSKLAGKTIGCVMSGGNIDTRTLTRVLAGPKGPALQSS